MGKRRPVSMRVTYHGNRTGYLAAGVHYLFFVSLYTNRQRAQPCLGRMAPIHCTSAWDFSGTGTTSTVQPAALIPGPTRELTCMAITQSFPFPPLFFCQHPVWLICLSKEKEGRRRRRRKIHRVHRGPHILVPAPRSLFLLFLASHASLRKLRADVSRI